MTKNIQKKKVEKSTIRQTQEDSRVKEALKKEKQPTSADDLSPLHNTIEIGTSGGDQRASEIELNKSTGRGKKAKNELRPQK